MLPHQRHPEPSRSPAHPQVLLEDLTVVIDIALLVAFATAVHLLRQKLITVATLAHALSVAFLVFTVGHYIERHVIGTDEVEDLVSRRGPGQGGRGSWWLASWPTAGLLAIGAVLALVTRFWNCKGGGGGCVAGGADALHNRCKMMRLKFYSPVFSATVVFVHLCISSRLNALLGGSVLHPRGGGYALAVLASPALLSTICLSGCASVWLYAVLVEEQAGGDSARYQPEIGSGASGEAASRTTRQRLARKRPGVPYPAWDARYSHRGEQGGGGPAHQQHRSSNHRNHGLSHHDEPSPPPSPCSLLGAGGSESDFLAFSSSFLFGGGERVAGGGTSGVGVAESTASAPSSSLSVSGKRWQQQQQQQQQQQIRQQRRPDGAAVAWDSGPQGGFRRVVGSGGGFAARPRSLLGGNDARHTSDSAPSPKPSPSRPSSESGSVFRGRSTMGNAFRGEGGGVAAASVSMEGSVVADSAPSTLDPPILPFPGGVGTGGSTFGSGAGRGPATKRPLLPGTAGNTGGWTSSSSSSASTSSSPGRSSRSMRRRRRDRRHERRSMSSDTSGSSSGTDDDDTGDGGAGNGGLRTRRPPSLSHAKTIPSSFGPFEREEEATRILLPRRGGSDSSSGGGSNTSMEEEEEEMEEWSVVNSGRRGRSPGISRAVVGAHAAGWGGGGGGNPGVGHARGHVGGSHPPVYNGTGREGSAGGLLRRRPAHRARQHTHAS